MPANSSFLDLYGASSATAAQIAQLQSSTSLANAQNVLGSLYAASNGTPATVSASTGGVLIALTVERANDPAAILNGNWAERQQALASTPDVWGTYGANQTTYQQTYNALATLFGSDAPMVAASASGLQSSAANRTIWMELSSALFNTLFGTPLLEVKQGAQTVTLAWGGNLDLSSLPAAIQDNISGIWPEIGNLPTSPVVADSVGSNPPAGPIGVGNAATEKVMATPTAIAGNYHFPLSPSVETPAVALVEVGLDQPGLLQDLNAYRAAIGLAPLTPAEFIIASGGNLPPGGSLGELALDISVVSGAVPNSTQILYSSLGHSPFVAYQQAFFDATNRPGVLSSSYGASSGPTLNSPFQAAWQQLFVDGLLANVSVHLAAGDSGSSGYIGNGTANAVHSQSATWALIVGGTSIATAYSAPSDTTLASLFTEAMRDNPVAVLDLVEAGLTTLPSDLSRTFPGEPARLLTGMFESVWQSFSFTPVGAGLLQAAFGQNSATSSGVETELPVPDFQLAFGLMPTNLSGATGRGLPDVSALSFGDTAYAAMSVNYIERTSTNPVGPGGGTSAASPLWASLTAQFAAIFSDQGLPNLGFYNDLLYGAAAVTPASFNDIQLGNNTTSFYGSTTPTGYIIQPGEYMVPTGEGYTASDGYDLTSGLGSPNGLVLGRTLSALAHAQMYSDMPGVVTGAGASTVSQALLVQNEFAPGIGLTVQVGGHAAVTMGANSELGWTARLAGQSVQGSFFDDDLVKLFDKSGKALPFELHATAGEFLGVRADGTPLSLYQSTYTSDFGFVQYGNAAASVVLARPLVVAQNAGGADDQTAVLRIRQDGTDNLQLEIYRVDDLSGSIGGLAPGQAGYAAAAAARDYHTTSGGTTIGGPGYGNFLQVQLLDVDQGDILAMKLTDLTTGGVSWALSSANAGRQPAIYAYGLNTLGFEDRPGLGDGDFNDLVVQFDFTSTSGHGWLV
ncbi:MAG TPA: hypothetical protein VK362_00665 [Reyranella sp.]|nr:hypothetical protein [Reyranella sp.]